MKLVKYVQLTDPFDANALLKALLDIPHSTYTAFTVVRMAKAKVCNLFFLICICINVHVYVDVDAYVHVLALLMIISLNLRGLTYLIML